MQYENYHTCLIIHYVPDLVTFFTQRLLSEYDMIWQTQNHSEQERWLVTEY